MKNRQLESTAEALKTLYGMLNRSRCAVQLAARTSVLVSGQLSGQSSVYRDRHSP